MKLNIGTKLKVVLTGGEIQDRLLSLPATGELVVTELSDGLIWSCNFISVEDEDTIIGVVRPLYKLIKKRNPYREVRVTDKTAPHGVSKNLRVRIFPNGILEVIEHGRRSGYETTAAALYTRLLIQSTQKPKKAQKRKARS